MQWKKPTYQTDDTRVINKFAFFPVTLKDNQTIVWLEWYQIIQLRSCNEFWINVYRFNFNTIKTPTRKIIDNTFYSTIKFSLPIIEKALLNHFDQKLNNKIDNIIIK